MKITIKTIVLLGFVTILAGCHYRCCDDENSFFLYKTRNDYSNNLMITFYSYTSDTGQIIRINGLYDRYPMKYANGYESRGCCTYNPENSAFLSITIEEWATIQKTTPWDSLKNYIIDMDPFVGFYQLKKNVDCNDVEMLNNWIINGELTKYFDRIK